MQKQLQNQQPRTNLRTFNPAEETNEWMNNGPIPGQDSSFQGGMSQKEIHRQNLALMMMRQGGGGGVQPPPPQAVQQARARSVNAYSTNKGAANRAKMNKSNISHGQHYSTGNDNSRSATSHSSRQNQNFLSDRLHHQYQQLMSDGANIITLGRGVDPSYMMSGGSVGAPSYLLTSFPGSATNQPFSQRVMQQQALPLYGNLINMNGLVGPQKLMTLDNLTITDTNIGGSNLNTTTPTPLNHQRRRVVPAHQKAQSVNHQSKGSYQQAYGSSNNKIIATQQFVDQPLLTLNPGNRVLNQTIQYGGGFCGAQNPGNYSGLAAVAPYTPLNFQTISMPQTSLASHKQHHNPTPSSYINNGYYYPLVQQQQEQFSPNKFQMEGNSSQIYNPFANYKQSVTAASISSSNSRISTSKLKQQQQQQQLNNTVAHIRSFSNYSKRSGTVQTPHGQSGQNNQKLSQSRRAMASSANKTMMIQQMTSSAAKGLNSLVSGSSINPLGAPIPAGKTSNIQVTEAQMLESEEFFEQGKLFLSEKKYKEAIKAFSKSYSLNQSNFDALFYKGVSELDNRQPDKAIVDLNELIDNCPDYRKTMFIVLSIAYRRINDYTGALRTLSRAIQKYPRYIEAYIARGQIYIFQKKWDKALSDFRVVIQVAPENGLGYLGQGDSLKGIGNYNGALQSYTRAVEIDNTCIQSGLMKRGILYLQMKYNDKALDDFNKLCEIAERETEDEFNMSSPNMTAAQHLSGSGSAIPQNLNSSGEALATAVLASQPMSSTTIQQQVPTANKNAQALAISKSYFYKAKALKKLGNCNDAILYFEQVIRMCDDQFLQSSALYEIAKIKIQQKDFYEAYYNLQRATFYKLKQKKLINYKIFTEGVIFLMKRKTKTGIKLLTSLIEKISSSSQVTQSDYITPLVYLYRAYGHFTQESYDMALKDYLKANQLSHGLNPSAAFNMTLCQGLKALEKKEYEMAISFFSKASQKLPGNRDPYFLRSVSIVRYAGQKPIKPATKTKMLRDARRDLNRALKHAPKDYQVMYYRGILNFALHNFFDAITDFETVIEKSEETNAKYYLARGRCYACLSMFKEAITDLSIAINLNKDLLDAYLNRGKCAYLIGDTGLAFMDFQKLIVLEPKNPMVHIYAGNLLMTTGSYEDATKAFTNADNIHKSPLALYQRARCHVALNNMNDSLKDLNKVIEASPNDKVAIADKDCLTALKLATVGFNGSNASAQVTSGSAQMNNSVMGQNPVNMQLPMEKQVYEKAIVILTKLISYEKNEHLAKINHDSSVLYQHSQIIPSAQRTKHDKVRAIRRRREQDRQMKAQGIADNPLRKNDLRFRVQQQQQQQDANEDELDDYDDISDVAADDIDKLSRQLEQASRAALGQGANGEESKTEAESRLAEAEEEETNYYKENIFNKEDYYLYRAVMYFYAGYYERALGDFEQSSSIMHAQKVLYPRNQFPDSGSLDENDHNGRPIKINADGEEEDDDNQSQESNQTDLSDVGLCSLNIHEFSFNTVLCLLMLKDYKKALTKLDYMFDTMPKKYASQLWLVRGLVNMQVPGQQAIAKKDFKRAHRYDHENAVRFLDQRQSVSLAIFPQQQRLCNGMAWIRVSFPGYTAALMLKPSFSFPFIKPPNMIPCVDASVLDSQFTAKALPLKPEAPWIKRCSFGIKFTDEIYFTDDDREATPDEEKEYKKRKQQQQQRAARAAAAFNRSLSERVVLRTNIFIEQPPPTAPGAPRAKRVKQQQPIAKPKEDEEDDIIYDEGDDDHLGAAEEAMALAEGGAFDEEIIEDDQIEYHPKKRIAAVNLTKVTGRLAKKKQYNEIVDDDDEEYSEENNNNHGDMEEGEDQSDAEFKAALERAKAGAKHLAQRPASKK